MTHCPYKQAKLLQQALSSDKMRVAFFIGAGCPMAIRQQDGKPLIPDVRALTSQVKEKIANSPHKDNLTKICDYLADENATIEHILSHLRQLREIIKKDGVFPITKTELENLDTEICKIITQVVAQDLPAGSDTPYHHLAAWISALTRAHPVDLFTTNYDLLLEQALEESRVPYFDGFVGSKNAFFDIAAIEHDKLPSRWARLWKLHGSINWWRTKSGHVERILRGQSDEQQMIFPSHLKYDQSRRLPYLAMLDRLKDFLAPSKGQAVLITCGYSFADDHLNEVILQGIGSNANAVCFGLLYGALDTNGTAVERAKSNPNLRLLASDGAVLNLMPGSWAAGTGSTDGNELYNIAVEEKHQAAQGQEPEIRSWSFKLGDFASLGKFLAAQLELRHTIGDKSNGL